MPKCNKPLMASIFLSLHEMERRGIIANPNPDAVEKLFDTIKKQMQWHGGEMDKIEDEERDMPFNINIVAKSMLSGVNYEADRAGVVNEIVPKSKRETVIIDKDLDADVRSLRIEKEAKDRYLSAAADGLMLSREMEDGMGIEVTIPSKGEKFDEYTNRLLDRINLQTGGKSDHYYKSFGGIQYPARSSAAMRAVLKSALLKVTTFEDEGMLSVNMVRHGDLKIVFGSELAHAVVDGLKQRREYMSEKWGEQYPDAFDEEGWRITFEEIGRAEAQNAALELVMMLSAFKTNFVKGKIALEQLTKNRTYSKLSKDDLVLTLELDKKPGSGALELPYDKKEKGKENTMVDRMDFTYKQLADDLVSYDVMRPDVISESFAFNGRILEHKIVFAEDAPDFKMSNAMMARDYYYSKETLDQFKIVVNDESDNGIKGSQADVFRSIAAKAKNVVTSSGTAISGKPGGFAYQLGNNGMGRDEIELNAAKLMEQCGVFTLRSELLKLTQAYSSGESLVRLYRKMIASENLNLKKEAENTAKELLQDLKGETDVASIAPSRAAKDIVALMRTAAMTKEPFSSKDDRSFITDAIRVALSASKVEKGTYRPPALLREEPGIYNPKTFIAAVKAAGKGNASIQTRENLKGRRERIVYDDRQAYLTKRENMLKEDNYLEKASIHTESAVLFDFIRQIGIDNYATELHSIYESGFRMFISALDPSQNDYAESNIKKVIPGGMEVKTFNSLIEKSSKTATDNMTGFYKIWLNNNGDVGKIRANFAKNETMEQKIALFEHLLVKADQYYFSKMAEIVKILEEQEGEVESVVSIEGFVMVGEFSIPEKLYNQTTGDEKPFVGNREFSSVNSYPYIDGSPAVFAIDVALDKPEWMRFASVAPVFHYEFHNRETTAIVERYNTTGVKKMLEERVGKESQKVAMASDRNLGSIINLYEYVSVLAERPDKSRPYALIVNCRGNKELTNALRAIDQRFLTENAIVLEEVGSNMMQITVNTYKKKGDEIQGYGVISNYIAISRGLDLSSMDYIAGTGHLTRPNDAIQLMARLFSVDRDHGEIGLHNGGLDVALKDCFVTKSGQKGGKSCALLHVSDVINDNLVPDKAEKYTDVSPSVALVSATGAGSSAMDVSEELTKDNLRGVVSDTISDRLYRSDKTYRGFMGGTLSDVKQTNPIASMFTPAKAYQDELAANPLVKKGSSAPEHEQEAHDEGYAASM